MEESSGYFKNTLIKLYLNRSEIFLIGIRIVE